MARRSASGHRASRRVERHGGLPLATIQQRWDLAMTMPKARADGVRAYDDDSTRTGATRGGAVAQRKGGRIELPVAEEVGHARSEVSGTELAAREGCDSAKTLRSAEAAAVGD